MAAYHSELQVGRLPPQIQQHFIACLTGQGTPRPIWSAAHSPKDRWQLLLAIGGVLALGLVFAGSDTQQGWPWIAGWLLAALALAWGAFGWRHTRQMAAALPFPAGTYLFASCLIEAREGVCHWFDLEELLEARPAWVGTELQLQLAFPRETVDLRVSGHQTVQTILNRFNAARASLLEMLAGQAWDQVAVLDPLYQARYGGNWEQYLQQPGVSWKEAARSAGTGWLTLSPAVARNGFIAGLLLAPGLWFGGNFLRDEAAFHSAQSANTVASWKKYLKQGGVRHFFEVRDRLLPTVALQGAKRAGGAAKLCEFLGEYGNSSVAGEARAALAEIDEAAIQQVKSETDPSMRDGLTILLRWLKDHATSSVEVRFGVSSQQSLAGLDDLLQQYAVKRGLQLDAAPMATSFAPENQRRREDALMTLLRQGFADIGLADAVTLKRGQTFSGTPAGFAAPAIAIQSVINLDFAGRGVGDGATRRFYLPLVFDFDLWIVVPGVTPAGLKFQAHPAEQLPEDVSGRSLYDGMAEIAFDEFHQRIAGALFPHHVPARTVAVATPSRRSEPPVQPRSSAGELRATATGFCISPRGYIVTARHFTAAVKTYKVLLGGNRVEAELVRDDAANDLAVLHLLANPPGELAVLPIRQDTTVKTGEPVCTIGFPNTDLQGRQWKQSRGDISSLTGMEDNPLMFQISVPVQPGNSGGPLLDLRGNVVGVIEKRLERNSSGQVAQNVNYAVKSSPLLKVAALLPDLGPLPAVANESLTYEDMLARAAKAVVLIEGY